MAVPKCIISQKGLDLDSCGFGDHGKISYASSSSIHSNIISNLYKFMYNAKKRTTDEKIDMKIKFFILILLILDLVNDIPCLKETSD